MNQGEMKVYTVYDVYKHYCEHLEFTKSYAVGNPTACIRTALLRYTLPGYNLENNKVDITQLKQISAQELTTILDVQETVFTKLGDQISASSKRTYRSVLKKMVTWAQQQSWWEEVSSVQVKPRRSMTGPRRNINDVRVINRKRQSTYVLTESEISIASSLQKNINSGGLYE